MGRQGFEAEFPVPEGIEWNELMRSYCWENTRTLCAYDDWWMVWQAARATPALPQVPEGMAIVPVEPTPKMIVAFRNSNGFQDGYKAMLAAAKEKQS